MTKKIELHPDFAEWYGEIMERFCEEKNIKSCAIWLVNQIGFGKGLQNSFEHNVTQKYLELKKDMYENKEKYTRAILDDNWTVRKEQLYYVEFPGISFNDRFLNMSIKSGECFIADSNEVNGYKHKFTEKEIKAIDERYWSFAEPVEEEP